MRRITAETVMRSADSSIAAICQAGEAGNVERFVSLLNTTQDGIGVRPRKECEMATAPLRHTMRGLDA